MICSYEVYSEQRQIDSGILGNYTVTRKCPDYCNSEEFDKALNKDIFKELIQTRCCFVSPALFHQDFVLSHQEVNSGNIGMALISVSKDEEEHYTFKFDVLDTPQGRIVASTLERGYPISIGICCCGDICEDGKMIDFEITSIYYSFSSLQGE